MGRHLALVLPGGAGGPYTAPLLVPSLAVEEAGARLMSFLIPSFGPEASSERTPSSSTPSSPSVSSRSWQSDARPG